MNKFEIKLNSQGIEALLKSQNMLDVCVEAAENIKNNYGPEAELDTYVGKTRVNVSIVAPYSAALEDNSLLKAVRE